MAPPRLTAFAHPPRGQSLPWGGPAGLGHSRYNWRMTNLNVPGLGTFADVAAYMQGGGEARAWCGAASWPAPTRRRRTPRSTRSRWRSAAMSRSSSEANYADAACARTTDHDAAFVDRLTLTPKTIAAMAAGLEEIVALPDPIGAITDLKFRPSGIQVGMMRVPLGVVSMHLRIAAQRHRRCRGALPQGG